MSCIICTFTVHVLRLFYKYVSHFENNVIFFYLLLVCSIHIRYIMTQCHVIRQNVMSWQYHMTEHNTQSGQCQANKQNKQSGQCQMFENNAQSGQCHMP